VRGAFPGAVATRAGRFQAAHGGTLFLDEIGEMPVALQVKLLRALQEKVVTKVGDTKSEEVDIRVLAATNKNLEEEIKAGAFREDLYYRLNVVSIHLPPLHKRDEDIMLIANYVLKRYSDYYDTKTLKMYMSGNRQQRQWIIDAARKNRIMPTTEGGLDFKLDLTHALDGYSGVEHNLPIAPIYSDVVELFKTSGTVNSPTLLVSYGGPFGENYYYATENVHDNEKLRRFMPHASVDTRARRRGPGAGGSPGQAGWFLEEEYIFPEHAEFVKKLIEGGGRAAVGSHGQLQGLGYHWELWSMASGGLEPHDALRAATLFGAEAIGFGNDLGSLEAGKLADILVIDGNPLEDLRATTDLQYVMKNGRLYNAETLAEVWPRQQALPDYLWRNLGPEGVSAGINR